MCYAYFGYASSVWGFKNFQAIDNIQNRAIRYFLGVHRFTPILALHGEVGWLPSKIRRWTNMIRYWNRLLQFDDDRITKLSFEMDFSRCHNNWCSELKDVLHKIGMEDFFHSKSIIDLQEAQQKLRHLYAETWIDFLEHVPKLRTYRTFKTVFETEEYVKLNLCKSERSHLAQFRCGILPLRIETGRYSGEKVEERVCDFCTSNATEYEKHFLLNCSHYTDIRAEVSLHRYNSRVFL